MASSTIAETTAPPLATMEAKMTVATCRDHCQQLKDIVSKEDPSSMLLVMAQTCTPPSKPRSPLPAMDPRLLALALTGYSQALESFLNGEGRRPSSSLASGGDEEAFLGQEQERLLDGVTAGGDTALHVVAGSHGGGGEALKKARLIHNKAGDLLSVKNSKGDTPLHCAAREWANIQMVPLLIVLAKIGHDNSFVKALLETENKSKWTVLHEAVRTGHIHIVKLLLEEDPTLASVPKHGISPLYLAISLGNRVMAETLYEMSGRVLSYSGPNGQNALHAAVLRSEGTRAHFLSNF